MTITAPRTNVRTTGDRKPSEGTRIGSDPSSPASRTVAVPLLLGAAAAPMGSWLKTPLRPWFAALMVAAATGGVASLGATTAATALAGTVVGAVALVAAVLVAAVTTVTAGLTAAPWPGISTAPCRHTDAVVGELVTVSASSLWTAWRAGIRIRARRRRSAWRRRSCMTVVTKLNSLSSLIGFLLLTLLFSIVPSVNERGLPLTALAAPLTSPMTCGAKRRLVLDCDGANSAGVATGRLGGYAPGAALLWVRRDDRDWRCVCI